VSDELRDLHERHERLTQLYRVSEIIHATLEPQEALQSIVDETVRIVRAGSGSIALVNPTTGFLEIQASSGLPGDASEFRLKVGEGITGWVARTGKPARVGDVASDRRYVMLRPGVRSELAIPLELRGSIRGVINVDSDRADAFSAADQELLEILALQVTRVIENTWLYEQLRLKARLFETLVSVSRTINSTLSLDEALSVVTREAAQLVDASMCSLMMLDGSGEWLDLRAHHGAGESHVNKPRLSTSDSMLGIVVRRKKPLQVENVQVSGRYQNVDIAREEGLVSLLSVPLIFGGEAIGTLSVYTDKSHSFSNEEIRILSAMAELSAIAIEKARLYERIVDVEEQLRQNEKLSALGLLAAEVAHEIRNPLTVMKMLFHSLDLRFPASDPRSRDVEIMGQKMDLLNRIVEQILDFARNSEPKLETVNLNELIEDLGLLTRHKLRNHGIKLERQLDPGLPLVEADAAQLEQAFLNLTLNAVEAMPDGGLLRITSRIQEESAGDARCVVIEFSDTGEGMTELQQQHAFTSLLQTTKSKGNGLGLAIVGRVIETHRGKVRIESNPGEGTRFIITLPVGRDEG